MLIFVKKILRVLIIIYTERNEKIISSKKWYNTRQLTAVVR